MRNRKCMLNAPQPPPGPHRSAPRPFLATLFMILSDLFVMVFCLTCAQIDEWPNCTQPQIVAISVTVNVERPRTRTPTLIQRHVANVQARFYDASSQAEEPEQLEQSQRNRRRQKLVCMPTRSGYQNRKLRIAGTEPETEATTRPESGSFAVLANGRGA